MTKSEHSTYGHWLYAMQNNRDFWDVVSNVTLIGGTAEKLVKERLKNINEFFPFRTDGGFYDVSEPQYPQEWRGEPWAPLGVEFHGQLDHFLNRSTDISVIVFVDSEKFAKKHTLMFHSLFKKATDSGKSISNFSGRVCYFHKKSDDEPDNFEGLVIEDYCYTDP